MGAIGDYVHYSAFGYMQHGITRHGQFTTYEDQKGRIRDLANSFKITNSKTLEQIENVVNGFSENPNFKNYLPEIQKKIIDTYQKQVTGVNFSNYTVDLVNPQGKYGVGRIKRHKRSDKSIHFDVKEVTNKLLKMEDLIDKKIRKGQIPKDNLSELQFQVQQAKKLYKDIFGRAVQQMKSWGYKPSKEKIDSTKENLLRVRMNQIIDQYLHVPPVSLMEGTLFEYVLAVAGYVGSGEALENINYTIEQGVKGLEKNVSVQTQNNFIKTPKVQQIINEKVKIDSNGVISRGQSKVDVSFTWNNESVNISAKNVNIYGNYKWITVVSDSPLLVMIMGMNPDFVNHYLNVYTYHGLPGKGGSAKVSIVGSQYTGVGDDMKYALFYEGLTGSTFHNGNDVANVFAINDKTSGKVRLIDMSYILSKMENSINTILVKVNGQDLTSMHFKNDWANSLDERIAHLVQQLHAAKVTIKFNLGSAINLI